MINYNQELLDWAVKNIKIWEEGLTHIRCDGSGVFFTCGNIWFLDDENEWIYSNALGCIDDFITITGDVVVSSPQVITREEWLEELKPTTRLEKLQRQRDLAKKVLDELDAKIRELGGEQ